MPITPDTKDWTWVLDRPCPECGFEAGPVDARQVAGMVRENAAVWRGILTQRDRLAERPSDDRWSALEYACHVRDVYRLYDERMAMMLAEDGPTFPNWDQDVTAVEDRYNEQDPSAVADQLTTTAARFATAIDALGDGDWERTGLRSDGARFTIDSFLRYMIHDPVHHVWDVEQGFARLVQR